MLCFHTRICVNIFLCVCISCQHPSNCQATKISEEKPCWHPILRNLISLHICMYLLLCILFVFQVDNSTAEHHHLTTESEMAQTRSRKSVRGRLKTLQNREEIAKKMDKMKQNRNLQLFLLLILPVIFLVFGVLVFPPWGIKDETKIKTVVEEVRSGGVEAERSEEQKPPDRKGMRDGDEEGEEAAVKDNNEQRKQSNIVEETEGKHRQKRDVGNTKEAIHKEVQADGKNISNVQEIESKVRLKPQQGSRDHQQNVSPKKEPVANENRVTSQSPLKIRSFELHGKRIKGEELKPRKPHNSSVRYV